MVKTRLEFTDHVEVDGKAPVNPDELGGIQLLEQASQRLFADYPVTALSPDGGYPILRLNVKDGVFLKDNCPLIVGQRKARVILLPLNPNCGTDWLDKFCHPVDGIINPLLGEWFQ